MAEEGIDRILVLFTIELTIEIDHELCGLLYVY